MLALGCVLIGVGLALAIVSGLADVIGLGARDEQFGWKQIVGLIVGFAAVDLGAVTVWIGIRRRRKNKRS